MTNVLSVLMAGALALGAEPPPVDVCDPAVAAFALAVHVCVTDHDGTTRLPASARLCRLDSGAEITLYRSSGPCFTACVPRTTYMFTVTYPGFSAFAVTVPSFVSEFSMRLFLDDDPANPRSFSPSSDHHPDTSSRHVFTERDLRAIPSRGGIEGALSTVPGVVIPPF